MLATKFHYVSLCVMFVAATLSGRAEAQAPSYLFQWGSSGSGPCQFSLPSGITVDASGNVYVADYGNGRVQKLSTTGTYEIEWSVAGGYPNGLALDGTGNIYVTCDGNNTVQKYTTNGLLIGQWGGYGSAEGQFNYPAGIAVHPNGHVYVADLFGFRMQEFGDDGTYVGQWSVQGPYGVAIDPAGDILVVANGAGIVAPYYIQKFSTSGISLAQIGGPGSGPGQLSHPTGLCTDPAGNVFVADYFNHRVQEFTGDGALAAVWGTFGTGAGQFNYPHSVAIDGRGLVFVADQYNARIEVFGFLPTASHTCSWGELKAKYR
jgi:tripartite motif-containing protein 71